MNDSRKPLTRILIDILLKSFSGWKNPERHTSAGRPEDVVTVPQPKENKMFVSPQEILMGRDVANPLTPEMKQNLDKLLVAVNRLRAMWGKPLVVSSGYRPPAANAAAGGAAKSNHMICAAVDFRDPKQELAKWLLQDLSILEDCGLWLEDPASTPTWCHVQIFPPKSGRRVFKP